MLVDFNGHIAVAAMKSTITLVHNADGTTTRTASTSSVYFSTEAGHEGEALGAAQSTSTYTFNGQREITAEAHTNTSTDFSTTAAAIGGQLVARAQAGAATPDRVAYFGHAVASDAKAHPFTYGMHVVGLALPFMEAGEAVDGIFTGIEALESAFDLKKEMREVPNQ